MDDATLPLLRLLSSDSECRSTQPSDSNTSDSDVFPFLVHSQISVTNGDPPEVDNGKLVRQKRRRTSAEDQATLEAEYKRNSKPDKLARLEIVKKVALGEKEVQIWFQNRRQNTRRKSRPLLPQEIAAFGLGGMAALSSVPISNDALNSSCSMIDITSSSTNAQLKNGGDTTHPPIEEPCKSPHSTTTSTPLAESDASTKPNQEGPLSVAEIPRNIQSLADIPTESPIPSQLQEQLPRAVGYLSNRRNASTCLASAPTSLQAANTATSSTLISFHPSSCPERLETASITTPIQKVRLSLSLDGKAELISTDTSPRSQLLRPSSSTSANPRRQCGLQRSQSALPFGPLQKSVSNAPFVPRMPIGRSRDARTWEFCCDTDARDELTKQAENESHGSAVAAISLLRSTSASKRNAPAQKSETNKRGKKPKLGRSSSSLAVLQSTGKPLARSPSGESDKENWAPLGESGNPRRRPVPSTRPKKGNHRRILEEPRVGSNRESGLIRPKVPRRKPTTVVVDIFEDNSRKAKVDREVENFMKGDVSPSKKGDLDCVQGLLSLSQGNWH